MVTIAAMLSVESIWFSRRKERGDRDEEADRAHAMFRHPRGDHITYLMIYAAWEERGFSEQWCVPRRVCMSTIGLVGLNTTSCL